MRNVRLVAAAALGVVMLGACGAEGQPDASAQHAVDHVVRQHIDFRNHGDLQGMRSTSCEDLYTSAQNLLALPKERQHAVVESMRQHPVRVHSVTADHVEDFRFNATLTGSADTPHGEQTASQHVTVRQYREGYRVCTMTP